MEKCKFQNLWLHKKDPNGVEISTWLRKASNNEEGSCVVCECSFSVSKGFQSVTQHAIGLKHKNNYSTKMSTLQSRLATTAQGGGDNENPPRILATHLCSLKDQATRAEIIWTINSAIHNYSAASCDNIKSVLNAMFPGAIPSNFSLARNKLSYLITEALGPYFYNQVIEDVKDSFYSIEYDETTNAENQKELQLMIRYWSESKEKINVKPLKLCLLGTQKVRTWLKIF